jgi:anion-transporting  ArsA/GET3 family ATPase
MSSLANRRFLFVTGKGGVGKTTVTAALALSFAAKGKRVLCCACNAKERFSTLFGVAPVGAEIAPVAERVWAVNMDPSRAMEEYGMLILRSRTLYKAVFDNRYVRSFFRATPGLYEWAMLGKAWYHTTETRSDGSPLYDVVLLDAPATGHGLDMLRVPKVIVDVVPPGILRRDADLAWAMFRDAAQTGVVVVTLPEEMPVNETVELAGSIEGELGLHIEQIVVNAMLPPLFSQEERASLQQPRELDESTSPDVAVAAGMRRAAREDVQARSLSRLTHELKTPKLYLPYLFDGAETRSSLDELVRRFASV